MTQLDSGVAWHASLTDSSAQLERISYANTDMFVKWMTIASAVARVMRSFPASRLTRPLMHKRKINGSITDPCEAPHIIDSKVMRNIFFYLVIN